MELKLQELKGLNGTIRNPYLAQDAAEALLLLERDTNGLTYTDLWLDPISYLVQKRLKKEFQLISYNPHNYGLALDLDVETTLKQKKIKYDDLIWLMEKRGWFCHRRDKQENLPGSEHFIYLGEYHSKYLEKCSYDPTTWNTSSEVRIWERFSQDFISVTIKIAETRLAQIGLFYGTKSGQKDLYLRESILAFQRTWDLPQTGTIDITFCRALTLVTADVKFS